MVRRKNRTIYDNDGTTIIEGEVEQTTELQATKQKAMNDESNFPSEIQTLDVLDAMVSYVPPRFSLLKQGEGAGQCVLCGKQTTYYKRKICLDCMEKYGEDLYDKAKEAIENGKAVIEL